MNVKYRDLFRSLNNKDKVWEICLDKEIKLNLENTCQLVLTIFDAQSCRIFGKFPESLALMVTSK
jgi:hypothetical protein